MVGRGFDRRWFLALLTVASLLPISIQVACVRPSVRLEEERAVAQFPTMDPRMILTLTAWPTPPPIITQPPTPTAAPRPLWTAPPQPSAPPSATLAFPAPTSSAEATIVPTAPEGSKPPAVRLLIPSLGLDIPVVEVSWDIVLGGGTWQSVWQTADSAAGHHRNSANPGETGNVVISGHHNTKGEVFRQISEIGQPGNVFSIGGKVVLVAQDGQQYTYTVVDWARFLEAGTAEQRREHARYLDPTTDATLTLITCWPYESNSHRVVVTAKLQS